MRCRTLYSFQEVTAQRMPPTFRTDLTCSREEQQGVVFYRIDDPRTKTSFRLYEIEYLIAQKLTGQRTLEQADGAVTAPGAPVPMSGEDTAKVEMAAEYTSPQPAQQESGTLELFDEE